MASLLPPFDTDRLQGDITLDHLIPATAPVYAPLPHDLHPELIAALRSGHVRHAGLDVFHAEPLAADHPLARMDNVTLTAHAGFRTLEASETLMRRAIDIVRAIAAPIPSLAP